MNRPLMFLTLLALWSSPAAAQVVLHRSASVTDVAEVRVEIADAPFFLSIEGAMPDGARLEMTLGGQSIGELSAYPIGGKACRLDLAMEERWLRHEIQGELLLRLAPSGDSHGRDLRVRKLPAAAVAVKLWDATERTLLPGLVELISMDGNDMPWFGHLRYGGPHGRTWILPSGSGTLILPTGMSLTLQAYSHPFRTPARQSLTLKPGRPAQLRLDLGADTRPEGAELLDHAEAVATWPEGARTAGRQVFGSDRLLVLRASFSSVRALERPEEFEARLLNPFQQDLVLSTELSQTGWLPAANAPRTLELRSGRLLHSNGPILDCEPFVRIRGEPLVRSRVRIVPCSGSGQFRVRNGSGILLDQTVDQATRIPLELEVPPGERLLLSFVGKPAIGTLRGAQPERAWLAVTVP